MEQPTQRQEVAVPAAVLEDGQPPARVEQTTGLGRLLLNSKPAYYVEFDSPSVGKIQGQALVDAGTIATVIVLLSDRGIPLAGTILVGVCSIGAFVTTRTSFGRHVFAVGGNAEASRRSGIRVTRVRIIVFVICSTMAAFGGIMGAARLLAVNQSSGGSDLLLLAIAGPVIAGTSLFGGRGSVWDALLGALVIGSISNGMDLLALQSSVKYMITGGVLLAAVVIDAVIRNQRQRAGALRQGVAPEPAGPAGAIARLEAPTPDVSVVPRGACAPSLS